LTGFFFTATKYLSCVTSLTVLAEREAKRDCASNLKREIETIFDDLEDSHGFTLAHVRPLCNSEGFQVSLCEEDCRETGGVDNSESKCSALFLLWN
jgi:hypothetical protein